MQPHQTVHHEHAEPLELFNLTGATDYFDSIDIREGVDRGIAPARYVVERDEYAFDLIPTGETAKQHDLPLYELRHVTSGDSIPHTVGQPAPLEVQLREAITAVGQLAHA